VIDTDPAFRPIRRRDGYLPLEDVGLIGDGTTSALIGLDGSVMWLCLPRFDSDPLFCSLHEESPDGIPGDEGAFLLCSFWLVENLARQGQLEKAAELHGSLCARASSVGLLPEQVDPSTGEFCGNFPQAFSHIGVDRRRRHADQDARRSASRRHRAGLTVQ
jgi:GH15 family glucan-1,4-alpha-glucosidase